MAFAGPKNRVGPEGPAGKNGKNGKDGRDGIDGRNGRDGKDGKDGITRVVYSGSFSSGGDAEPTPPGEAVPFTVVSTSVNYVVTNEDFVRVTGAGPVQITLPAVGTKRVCIKNYSTGIVTIVAPSGTVNDQVNIQLRAKTPAGLGNSIDLIFQGGQFWVV